MFSLKERSKDIISDLYGGGINWALISASQEDRSHVVPALTVSRRVSYQIDVQVE
jgi:hypothetical protein